MDNYPKISGQFLIGGEWLRADQCTPVYNPARKDEMVGEVAQCTEADVRRAIEVAAETFKTWSQTSIDERAQLMQQAGQALSKVVEELVPLFVRENGKTLVEAKKEILRSIEAMKSGAAALGEWWRVRDVGRAMQKVQVRRRARGVVAVISPWNSPMLLSFKRLVPAVLAGNTVIVKPASNCPLTVLNSLQIMASFFPPGVINVVTGSGSTVGGLLCTDPTVRSIAFTGGTETGKQIMSLASGTLKKLYMELGGNDPALVLEDAVLDKPAIQRMRGAILRSAGQVCSAIKRIYVHESRFEELNSKLSRAFAEVIVGNGLQPDTTMGPLNNQAQFDFVQQLLERTAQSGAEIQEYGQKLDSDTWAAGYFMLPKIVTGIEHDHDLVAAEQFGPIIPIVTFTDEEEALTMANDTPYGLRASVWTQDQEKAMSFADRLEAGAVFYNNHTVFQDIYLDFPGIKESGVSRETEWSSLELFTDSYGFAE